MSCTPTFLTTGFVHTFIPRRVRSSLRSFQGKACTARYKATDIVYRTTATPQATLTLPHVPVLLSEVCNSFATHIPSFLDCTIGAGGHARQLLHEKHINRYVALDKDPHALRIAAKTLSNFDNVHFVRSDFRCLRAVLDKLSMCSVHSVLLDVGASSMQLDQAERGFSFTRDGPIDMRMSCAGMSAEELLHDATEQELATMFWELGEERMSRQIARAIVQERKSSVIRSTKQLATIVERIKGWRKKGVHPATKVFQALRIATNDELSALEEALTDVVDVLMPHGRVAVISFHSLEDRVAKRVFRSASERKGGVKLITKKPVTASEDECERNPRARSAKLRVVEKLEADETPRTKVNKYRDR